MLLLLRTVDDLDSDRACLVATGEVDTRLRERGCKGVIGTELVRRRCLAAVLPGSPSGVGRLLGVGGGFDDCGFAASPNARRVAFTTWVASAALSLVERPSCSGALEVLDGFFESALVVVFALDRDVFSAVD